MSAKLLAAAEALVAAIKSECGAKPLKGNRTTPITTYRGGNSEQDLLDVARRAVRYARAGKTLSNAERKVARNVMKAFKSAHRVSNTNGSDIFTVNGLRG